MDFQSFKNDDKTVFATIRALEIIGEAVKKIPSNIRNKYEKIPWKEIAGMRDKLIHEYFGINIKVVWKTVKENVSFIKPLFVKMQDAIMPCLQNNSYIFHR